MSLGVQNVWYIVQIQLKTEMFTCYIINNTMTMREGVRVFMRLLHIQPLAYVSHKPIQRVLHFPCDCSPGVGVAYCQ